MRCRLAAGLTFPRWRLGKIGLDENITDMVFAQRSGVYFAKQQGMMMWSMCIVKVGTLIAINSSVTVSSIKEAQYGYFF